MTPTLDAVVLQALASTTGSATGAHVHRMAGAGSPDGVRRVLARLVRQGIVLSEEHAHATLYRLNRDHVAADAILGLTHIRPRIVSNIEAAIAGWSAAPVHASLFGSFARGSADEVSDIDILLVVDVEPDELDDDVVPEVWRDQVNRLSGDIHRWTGNDAHIVDVARRRLGPMVQLDDPLVDSWRADHIHLAGERLLDVLRTERIRAETATAGAA